MPVSQSPEGKLHFTVDSHLLLELGERLVAKRSIALAELVKNGYDSDAPKVTITLQNVSKPGGTIIVKDTGLGMDFDAFRRGWMLIATGEKRAHPFSKKYRRPRVGAKGIGRFACRVLSNRLILESVAQFARGRKEKVEALFEWGKFKSGLMVDQIAVPYKRKNVSFDTPTGTTLTLEDTREAWDADDIRALRNDLISLVSVFTPELGPEPKQSRKKKRDPGFQIVIEVPEFKEFEGPIAEQFLESAWGRLVGRINSQGSPKYGLQIRGSKKLFVFRPKRKFPKMGMASFRVHAFVFRTEYFKGLEITMRDAQRIGRERGGVKIYVDKFRVFPYGDPRDDWLDLDKDRGRRLTRFKELGVSEEDTERAMLFLPGNNQLFGGVFLSRFSNPNITLTITRDHLLENEAFAELRSFVRLGIEWLTREYAVWSAPTRERARIGPSPLRPLEIAKNRIEKKRDDLGPEATAEILQSLELARSSFEERENDRISQIAMLRVLATAGTMVTIFEHELSDMIAGLENVLRELADFARNIPEVQRNKLAEIANKLDNWIKGMNHYAEQLGLLAGRETRDRQRSFPLLPLVQESAAPFAHHFDGSATKFNVDDIPPDIRLPPMYRCEVYSIFTNLITNAAKAVKKSKADRKIVVKASKSNHHIRILVLDTGPGVPEDRRDLVFEPFVSDTEPDPVLGQGTGLGLTIVRDIVETYGGTVRFIDSPEGWGACVELVFPEEY